MFNHDAQGDFNVSRQNPGKCIKVFNSAMEITATFSGDQADEAYSFFLNGFSCRGGDSLFDLDTGHFIIGTVDQIDAEPAAVNKAVLKLGAFGGESTEAQEANNAANTRAKRDAVREG